MPDRLMLTYLMDQLDVAVPQREMPPLVGRWYRLMGFVLFVSLCASWCHRRSSRVTVVPSEPGVKPDMQPQGVGDAVRRCDAVGEWDSIDVQVKMNNDISSYGAHGLWRSWRRLLVRSQDERRDGI